MSDKNLKKSVKRAIRLHLQEAQNQGPTTQKQAVLAKISPFHLLPDQKQRIDEAHSPTALFNLAERQHELTPFEADTLAEPLFDPSNPNNDALTPDEILNQIFQPGYALANSNLDSLFPQRIKVAWKLTRELGRQLGVIRPGDSLIDLLTNEIDWQTPQPKRYYNPEESGYTCNALKYIIKDAEELLPPYQANGRPGLTIGPPPIPRMYVDAATGNVRPNYNPHNDHGQDPLLHLYLEALEELATSMNLHTTDYGHAGLIGLLNPLTVRIAWPGRKAIGTYEQTIIKETLYKIVKKSVHVARQYLQEEYDLPAQEVDGMIRLAREYARQITSGNIEDDKGVMILRLEDFLSRARGFGDWRAEMYALKQLALVLGITRSEPEDAMKDIIDTVKKVSGARDMKTVMNEAQQNATNQPRLE